MLEGVTCYAAVRIFRFSLKSLSSIVFLQKSQYCCSIVIILVLGWFRFGFYEEIQKPCLRRALQPASGQEPLHAVRVGLSQFRCHLPAIFALPPRLAIRAGRRPHPAADTQHAESAGQLGSDSSARVCVPWLSRLSSLFGRFACSLCSSVVICFPFRIKFTTFCGQVGL